MFLSSMHFLTNITCQAAADLMTILEHIPDRDLKVAWVGDGNNVLHDLMLSSNVRH